MAILVRNEGAKINSAINVTPMVDVMLVLLIIFMVVIPRLHRGPEIQLARANHPLRMLDAENDSALVVAVTREGQVFLGNEKINAADLKDRIRERLASHPDKAAFVKADARCRYIKVTEVVDKMRSAGVSELGLLTEQRGK